MVRMTDLLKKVKKQLSAGSQVSKAENEKTQIIERKTDKPAESVSPKTTPGKERIDFSKIILGGRKEQLDEETTHIIQATTDSEEEAKKIYLESLESIKKIFAAYKEGSEIEQDDIFNIARRIVNNILLGSQQLLKLFHELDSPELYTYYNAINVSILSAEIGIAYNYNKSTLLDLAVVGLLHDIDLIKNKDVIDRPQKLEEDEIKEIKKHPLNVALYVDNAFKLSEQKVNAILQHHERRGGQGYPTGLTEADINDLAVIIGIADTYEAMIHSRPYKKRIAPYTAVLNIIEQGKGLFPAEAIKALITRVSLYPVGSWVELNTGEICKVIVTNLNSPLRPVVNILMDKDRNRFKEVRTIDLRKVPSLYITREVTEEMNIETIEEGGDKQ